MARPDLETLLPIELIRQHTKTDDAPGVSDELLSLYREAAFEAAALYTGRSWGAGPRTVTQAVRGTFGERIRVPLAAPASDGIVTLVAGRAMFVVQIAAGAREIEIGPDMRDAHGNRLMCNPCTGAGAGGMTLQYRTAGEAAAMPADVRLGALQFIAYAIGNPGDVANAGRAALASGAIATWRRHNAGPFF